MERERKVFVSLSFHILFPIFSTDEKMGLDPQLFSIFLHFKVRFDLWDYSHTSNM